jgi:hypothetical protein
MEPLPLVKNFWIILFPGLNKACSAEVTCHSKEIGDFSRTSRNTRLFPINNVDCGFEVSEEVLQVIQGIAKRFRDCSSPVALSPLTFQFPGLGTISLLTLH